MYSCAYVFIIVKPTPPPNALGRKSLNLREINDFFFSERQIIIFNKNQKQAPGNRAAEQKDCVSFTRALCVNPNSVLDVLWKWRAPATHTYYIHIYTHMGRKNNAKCIKIHNKTYTHNVSLRIIFTAFQRAWPICAQLLCVYAYIRTL